MDLATSTQALLGLFQMALDLDHHPKEPLLSSLDGTVVLDRDVLQVAGFGNTRHVYPHRRFMDDSWPAKDFRHQIRQAIGQLLEYTYCEVPAEHPDYSFEGTSGESHKFAFSGGGEE